MNELALFAGGGGGLLGSKLLGWRTVCYVEIDRYCQKIIMQRIRDGCLDDAPLWDDIRTFNGHPWAGRVDIVTGGFPCQPWSVAGRRKGSADDRNLWPDTIRVIREVMPRYLLLENVPGLKSIPYFRETILNDLSESGYCVRWDVISAAHVGANHKRERLWIVGKLVFNSRYPISSRGEHEQQSTTVKEWETNRIGEICQDVADFEGDTFRTGLCQGESTKQRGGRSGDGGSQIPDAMPEGLAKREEQRCAEGSTQRSDWWAVEPRICGVAHGVASRVDRLKTLGNGQVPAVVKFVWENLGWK